MLETIGIFNEIFFENLELILTSLGKILEYPGTNRTSSYVRASEIILLGGFFMQLLTNCMQIYKLQINHDTESKLKSL